MRPFVHHRPAPATLPPLGVWLRGVIEWLALARARWSRRRKA